MNVQSLSFTPEAKVEMQFPMQFSFLMLLGTVEMQATSVGRPSTLTRQVPSYPVNSDLACQLLQLGV